MPHRGRMPVRRRRRRPLMTFGRRVRAIVNESTETKFIRHTGQGALITGADIYLVLPAIVQGVNQAQRIGNSVRLKSIHARFRLSNISAVNAQSVRVQLFKDKEVPVPINVPPQATIIDPPDTDRFVIKMDVWRYLLAKDSGYQNQVNWSYNHRFPGSGQLVEYDGNGQLDLVSNGWALYATTDAAGGIINFQYSIAVYYKDG